MNGLLQQRGGVRSARRERYIRSLREFTDALDVLPTKIGNKIMVAPDGCWLWFGARTGGGYGHVRWDGRNRGAHRVVYEELIGPIPTGLVLDHLCRTPHCVRPGHLDPVTQAENTKRGQGPNGVPSGQRRAQLLREGLA